MNNKTQKSYLLSLKITGLIILALLVYITILSINKPDKKTFAFSFTVNTTKDLPDAKLGDGICDNGFGFCSLRAAIEEINISPKDQNNINFDLIGDGPFVIELKSPLVINNDYTNINGYTQKLSKQNSSKFGEINANLAIQLDGKKLKSSESALIINSHNNKIAGLVINGASKAQILINGQHNHIMGNFIGTSTNGLKSIYNENKTGHGIEISKEATHNVIGWSVQLSAGPHERNLISGNGKNGIFCNNCNQNIIAGNLIGVNKNAEYALPNQEYGIYLESAFNNLIGTNGNDISDNYEGNIISGNKIDGIKQYLTHNTIISGNHIGICYTKTKDQYEPTKCANGFYGISDIKGSKNIIGSNNEGSSTSEIDEKNIIAGNNVGGIYLENTLNNIITNNYLSKTPNGSIFKNLQSDFVKKHHNESIIKNNITID